MYIVCLVKGTDGVNDFVEQLFFPFGVTELFDSIEVLKRAAKRYAIRGWSEGVVRLVLTDPESNSLTLLLPRQKRLLRRIHSRQRQ